MTRRGSSRGLSLLEVLITLMLLSTTLIAFAAVYPAAFKLNRKTHRSVQAAELAGAVAEELRTLPFNRPSALSPGGLYLEDFARDGGWRPDNARFRNFPRTEIPEPYSLVSEDGEERGILVVGDTPFTYADIRVTVYWMEPVNHQMVQRHVTIHTARTGNR
jgi:type II secretory pathway pseudopilin PulG